MRKKIVRIFFEIFPKKSTPSYPKKKSIWFYYLTKGLIHRKCIIVSRECALISSIIRLLYTYLINVKIRDYVVVLTSKNRSESMGVLLDSDTNWWRGYFEVDTGVFGTYTITKCYWFKLQKIVEICKIVFF